MVGHHLHSQIVATVGCDREAARRRKRQRRPTGVTELSGMMQLKGLQMPGPSMLL